jgi:transcriptional regulator with XRE-family HTH domain
MEHEAEPPEGDEVPELPLLPGFREMALRRMSARRRRLVADLTAQRRSAGLSQTEVAARMGTSQSAVARLETGEADVRVSTLERYAAAVGSQLAWQAQAGQAQPGPAEPGKPGFGPSALGPPEFSQPELSEPGLSQPELSEPGLSQPASSQPGHTGPGISQQEFGQPGRIQSGPGQEGQP